ncbi:MAG: hypothetical protein ACJ72G_15310 [Friedmanniella sp.]|jgi:hypothetical protein
MTAAGPETDGGEALERSEGLIEEAKGASRPALAHTDGDPDKEEFDAERFPKPGDEDDPAERF